MERRPIPHRIEMELEPNTSITVRNNRVLLLHTTQSPIVRICKVQSNRVEADESNIKPNDINSKIKRARHALSTLLSNQVKAGETDIKIDDIDCHLTIKRARKAQTAPSDSSGPCCSIPQFLFEVMGEHPPIVPPPLPDFGEGFVTPPKKYRKDAQGLHLIKQRDKVQEKWQNAPWNIKVLNVYKRNSVNETSLQQWNALLGHPVALVKGRWMIASEIKSGVLLTWPQEIMAWWEHLSVAIRSNDRMQPRMVWPPIACCHAGSSILIKEIIVGIIKSNEPDVWLIVQANPKGISNPYVFKCDRVSFSLVEWRWTMQGWATPTMVDWHSLSPVPTSCRPVTSLYPPFDALRAATTTLMANGFPAGIARIVLDFANDYGWPRPGPIVPAWSAVPADSCNEFKMTEQKAIEPIAPKTFKRKYTEELEPNSDKDEDQEDEEEQNGEHD